MVCWTSFVSVFLDTLWTFCVCCLKTAFCVIYWKDIFSLPCAIESFVFSWNHTLCVLQILSAAVVLIQYSNISLPNDVRHLAPHTEITPLTANGPLSMTAS